MAIIDAELLKRKENLSIVVKCSRLIGTEKRQKQFLLGFRKTNGLRNIELKYPHLDHTDHNELTYLFLFDKIR